MRNTYPGMCYRCGERVEAGEGHFELVSRIQRNKWGCGFNVKWLVQHVTCAIVWRGTCRHYIYAPDVALPVTEDE